MNQRMSVTCFAAAAVCAASIAAPASAAAQSPSAQSPSFAATDAADKKQPPRPPSTTPDYRLGSGDKLRIEVYKDPQLSQSVQIRPDGKITLPLVGDIEATGRTPIELRDHIAQQLKEYMTNPVVTVIVVEATAAMAYVMGEVNHPGAVNMQGGPLTVIQALALAGGLKDFADEKNIKILRRSQSGVETISFNYKDGIRGAKPVYLIPGDTVVVPD
jgi:polysaccharide export outer membrane protein